LFIKKKEIYNILYKTTLIKLEIDKSNAYKLNENQSMRPD